MASWRFSRSQGSHKYLENKHRAAGRHKKARYHNLVRQRQTKDGKVASRSVREKIYKSVVN